MLLSFLLSICFVFPSEDKMVLLQNKLKKSDAYAWQRLLQWNLHEPFPYLGIRHFIWFPKGQSFPVEEDFPKLLMFLKNQGVKMPAWLDNNTYCPWSSREEFEADKIKQQEIRSLLENSLNLQIKFLVTRSFESFEKIVSSEPEETSELMKQKITKLLADPRGLYALVDYCQFKGSGLNAIEFKNGKGFGLKQVLEAIDLADCSVEGFAKTAKDILKERVQHSEGVDTKWLSGWMKRLDQYRMQ